MVVPQFERPSDALKVTPVVQSCDVLLDGEPEESRDEVAPAEDEDEQASVDESVHQDPLVGIQQDAPVVRSWTCVQRLLE